MNADKIILAGILIGQFAIASQIGRKYGNGRLRNHAGGFETRGLTSAMLATSMSK